MGLFKRRLSPEEESYLERERELKREIALMTRVNKLEERKRYFEARHEANMEAVVERARLDADALAKGQEPTTRKQSGVTRFLEGVAKARRYYRLPNFSSMPSEYNRRERQEDSE